MNYSYLKKLIQQNLFQTLLILNFLIISSAFYIEYILKVPACNLCLYQRIPYYLSILILLYMVFNKSTNIILMGFLAILMLSNIVLSLYHVGVEQKIISEPILCKSNSNFQNVDQLLENLKNNTFISCKDINFTFLGFSLASINVFISTILAYFYVIMILNVEKIRRNYKS